MLAAVIKFDSYIKFLAGSFEQECAMSVAQVRFIISFSGSMVFSPAILTTLEVSSFNFCTIIISMSLLHLNYCHHQLHTEATA